MATSIFHTIAFDNSFVLHDGRFVIDIDHAGKLNAFISTVSFMYYIDELLVVAEEDKLKLAIHFVILFGITVEDVKEMNKLVLVDIVVGIEDIIE